MSTPVRSGSKKARSAGKRKAGSTGSATVKGQSASAAAAAEKQRTARTTVSAASLAAGRITRATTVDGVRAMGLGRRGRSLLGAVRALVGGLDGTGGVAPFVPPTGRLSRRMRMQEWSRRGFVPLSPSKQKLRHRILPRTVIGIAGMLMAAGIGAAFSGASFYAYYDNRLAENERAVARFVDGFDQQFTDAAGALDEMRTDAVSTIRAELGPLDAYVSDARGVIDLPSTAGPSVWLVETRDENGRTGYGSAFAIVGHKGGTALVASYAVVLASTVSPGPGIELVKGDERIPAELWAWDEERDLALLVVDRQIPILEMAGDSAQLRAVGGRVFAIGGFGGQGATASPGVLIDHSTIGLQHTAALGPLYLGGPLVNSEGRVLGMASAAYAPFGIDPGDVRQAPDVRAICVKILRCSEIEEEPSTEPDGQSSDGIEAEGGETLDGQDRTVLEVEVGSSD